MSICRCQFDDGGKDQCPVHGGPDAFDRWFADLVKLNQSDDAYSDLNQEDWREYWEDAYSPSDA